MDGILVVITTILAIWLIYLVFRFLYSLETDTREVWTDSVQPFFGRFVCFIIWIPLAVFKVAFWIAGGIAAIFLLGKTNDWMNRK